MTWEGAEENYNVFRWYRAGWGRYTQSDPLDKTEPRIHFFSDLMAGHVLRENEFFYGLANPVRFADPVGLLPCGAVCAQGYFEALQHLHTARTWINVASAGVAIAGGIAGARVGGAIGGAVGALVGWGASQAIGNAMIPPSWQEQLAYSVFKHCLSNCPSNYQACNSNGRGGI